MVRQLYCAAPGAREADDNSRRPAGRFVIQSRFSATGGLGYSTAVYLPSSFHETRIPLLQDLMRGNPLATLITMDSAGVVADHIPMHLLEAPEPFGLLRGHVARANVLWREHPEDKEALAVFQGPQVYVSPSFYPTKKLTGEVVPTWNYAVVHAHGRLRFIHDADWLLELVASLTNTHEAGRAAPWAVGDAPAPYIEKMLAAIVGFEFTITRLSGKWKASQNRNAADREGVASGLRSSDDPASRAIADLVPKT